MPNINSANIASIQFNKSVGAPPTPPVNFVDVYVDVDFIMKMKDAGGNITPIGAFNSFDVAGSSGTPQTITDGDTLTIAAGTNISTSASATDTVTISFSGTLPITSGGTGQTTQQTAINALTAVSGATNEYVLTKDTSSGDALWKAVPGAVGSIVKSPTASDNIILPTGNYVPLQLQTYPSSFQNLLEFRNDSGALISQFGYNGWFLVGDWGDPENPVLVYYDNNDLIANSAVYTQHDCYPSPDQPSVFVNAAEFWTYFGQDTSPSTGQISAMTAGAYITRNGGAPVYTLDIYGGASGIDTPTISDVHLIHVRATEQASATITNNCALYIESQSAGTNNYAIYTNAGDIRLMSSSADKIGFHGNAPVAKQTVAGSRGGNAALADLLTKLANLGLITDGTSA